MSDTNNTGFGQFTNKSLSSPHTFSSLDDIDLTADGSLALRIVIAMIYSVVCAMGLIGNLLVFFLMSIKQAKKKSTINFFVINLSVTDFQFVLTLPFWAVDTALDFSWPFGDAMCKIILSVTVMNMYASVFFLTAMSITRYWSVASGLRNRYRSISAKWVSAALWTLALGATAPTTIFSSVNIVAGEKLCLLRFPDGQHRLALYHIQKILIAFILPMLILSVSYLMLLRVVRRQCVRNNQPRARSKITRSVTVIVLSFFICWMPNHAVTLWGVLVKLNIVYWDKAYYITHTYVFPVTVCLAHANSCLNPVLYCLMRQDFRRMLKSLFKCTSSPGVSNTCKAYKPCATVKTKQGGDGTAIHLNEIEQQKCHLSVIA